MFFSLVCKETHYRSNILQNLKFDYSTNKTLQCFYQLHLALRLTPEYYISTVHSIQISHFLQGPSPDL